MCQYSWRRPQRYPCRDGRILGEPDLFDEQGEVLCFEATWNYTNSTTGFGFFSGRRYLPEVFRSPYVATKDTWPIAIANPLLEYGTTS